MVFSPHSYFSNYNRKKVTQVWAGAWRVRLLAKGAPRNIVQLPALAEDHALAEGLSRAICAVPV
jgi:hypothetical protein